MGMNLKSPSLCTHYLRMIPYGTDSVMSTCTGFCYEFENEIYLITNGHNVTRLNPETKQRISNSAAFPIKIHTKVRLIKTGEPSLMGLPKDYVTIDLYEDDEYKTPAWFIHPQKGYDIDVIAIPWVKKSEIPSAVKLFPINNLDLDDRFGVFAGDDAFILGYPFDLTSGYELPIWKRATIATEPFVNINDLPLMYVDTASRSGMSGSPVLIERSGLHGGDGKSVPFEIMGTIRSFVGVYSGRLGAKDNLDAQLGLVWKEQVILEIIKGGFKSSVDFQAI